MKAAWLVVLAACSSSSSASHKREYKLSELHLAQFLGGLPLDGGTLTVDLSQDPDAITDWSKVTGTVTLDCGGCVLGDDHAVLHSNGPFGGDLHFGHISWDDATTRAVFGGGKIAITGHWRGDVDLDVKADVMLASRAVVGCLAFRPAERLLARDEKLHNIFMLTGAPKGDDGRMYIRVAGPLDRLRYMPQLCEAPAP